MKYIPILLVYLTIISCHRDNSTTSGNHYFSKQNNCSEQSEHFENNGRISLYYFDSKGLMSDSEYEESPSNIVKSRLRSDSAFYEMAIESFDFFVFDHECPAGQNKNQEFNILSYPTILLVDEDENILSRRVGMTSTRRIADNIRQHMLSARHEEEGNSEKLLDISERASLYDRIRTTPSRDPLYDVDFLSRRWHLDSIIFEVDNDPRTTDPVWTGTIRGYFKTRSILSV